jgi:hypothetical protein
VVSSAFGINRDEAEISQIQPAGDFSGLEFRWNLARFLERSFREFSGQTMTPCDCTKIRFWISGLPESLHHPHGTRLAPAPRPPDRSNFDDLSYLRPCEIAALDRNGPTSGVPVGHDLESAAIPLHEADPTRSRTLEDRIEFSPATLRIREFLDQNAISGPSFGQIVQFQHPIRASNRAPTCVATLDNALEEPIGSSQPIAKAQALDHATPLEFTKNPLQ